MVEDNGYVLEQLSSSYPYKRAWRWNGHQWNVTNTSLGEGYLPIIMGVALVMLSIGLPLALANQFNLGTVLWAIVLLLLALLPALMVLLAYRR